MLEWCTSNVGKHQNFCLGFLLGVYENSSCLTSRETPDWEDLKKAYVRWMYTQGDKTPVSATASAMLAFNKQYNCTSTLLIYMQKSK